MVVMLLQKVPVSLKGDLTRWLVEVGMGVYIGHVTAMVRDRLWEKCSKSRSAGRVFQAWTTNNEQHFGMRMVGDPFHQVVDWEGVLLVQERVDRLKPAQKRRIKKGV